jgi:hypothetical protein
MKIASVDLGKHTGLSASMQSRLENGKKCLRPKPEANGGNKRFLRIEISSVR